MLVFGSDDAESTATAGAGKVWEWEASGFGCRKLTKPLFWGTPVYVVRTDFLFFGLASR
jgi:hypothetical protein